jgi:hypothetical protein
VKKKMRISYEGHRGWMDTGPQTVRFYDRPFNNISEAIKLLLKYIDPPVLCENYTTWFYRGKVGLISTLDRQIFYDRRWLPDEEFAKDYIKTGGK